MIDGQWEEERLAYGRRERRKRWEYWSGYVLYFPISFYCIFYLALRYRGIFTFTAANPAMEDGGLINESKIEILNELSKSKDESIPRFLPLRMSEGKESLKEKVLRAIDDGEVQFPCVFKPDAGQRGTGVAVVHDRERLLEHLQGMSEDHLIQAYCPGVEYSVFYYRFPSQSSGHIFSITSKELPFVIGDGESTLKTLILKHDRHVCMASYLFSILKDRLSEVPSEGARVILNEVGAHCKGSRFMDGTPLITDALLERINQLMKERVDLCFGRFDVMVPSEDALKKGEGLKVIELNGVSSEATHIYDEKHSIWYAWKTLFKQWHLVYKIGYEQVQRGHRRSSFFKVMSQIANYRGKVVTYSGVKEG